MVTAAPPSKVAGSPRSDDDKAGTPLAGLSCSCWVLHKPIDKSSAWGQKTPYYNRPTQDGLRGHFVLRAIGKRFGKDRTAGCEKVRRPPVPIGLFAGGRWIRTIGPWLTRRGFRHRKCRYLAE